MNWYLVFGHGFDTTDSLMEPQPRRSRDILESVVSQPWPQTRYQFLHHTAMHLFHPTESPIHRPAARDFWLGFDGICAFIIVMGIFVLFRFQELVIVILWKCFCVSVLSCHQIMSWFHTWTDSLAVVQCDMFWPDLIINIHLKARNILHEIWSIRSSLMMWTPGPWQHGGRHLEW